MSVKQPPIYVYSTIDMPGVVADNTFVSFFNPANSGKVMLAIQGIVTTYSTGASTTATSMATYNVSAASAGTLIAASTIYRLASYWPNPTLEVRIGNPTRTVTSLPLAVFPPPLSTGAGGNTSGAISTPSPGGVPYLPGEGFCYRTTSGNTNQMWNITFIWGETSL